MEDSAPRTQQNLLLIHSKSVDAEIIMGTLHTPKGHLLGCLGEVMS